MRSHLTVCVLAFAICFSAVLGASNLRSRHELHKIQPTTDLGHSVLMQLQAHVRARAPVDEILQLIESIRKMLQDEQQKANEAHTTQLTKCKTDEEALNASIATQTNNLEAANRMIETLENRISVTTDSIAAKESSITQTKADIEALKTQMATAQSEHEAAVSDLSKKIADTEAAIEAIKQVKGMIQGSALETTSTSSTSSTSSDTDTAAATLLELSKHRLAHAPQVTGLLQVAAKMAESGDEDVESLVRLLDKLQTSLEEVLEKYRSELSSENDTYAQAKDSMEAQLQGLQTLLTSHSTQLATRKGDLSSMEGDLSDEKAKKSAAEQMLDSAYQQRAILRTQCANKKESHYSETRRRHDALDVLAAVEDLVRSKLVTMNNHLKEQVQHVSLHATGATGGSS